MPAAKPTNAASPEHPPAEAPASRLDEFFEENLRKILLGLGLLVVVLLVIAVSRYFSHQTELEAAEAFTSAKTVEDCDVIAQKYAGTQAAGNSLLLKAALLWEAGKKESSVKVIEDFIKSQPDHPLLPHAMVGLGSKQASLGEKDAARRTLETVVRDHAKSEAAAAAQTQLGDMLWAEGKIEEAKKIFTELPRNNPGSPFVEQVEQRVKMMNAGLPTKEVDPPPAPKPAEAPKPAAPTLPGIPTIDVPSLITPPGAPKPPAAAPTPVPVPAPAPKPENKAPAPVPATPKP